MYNQERYIGECVESALSQNYENLEVVVIDDGSTDPTPKILQGFGQRIRYLRQENRGVAAARNVGLRLAQGSLVAWLDSDDVYLPGKIRDQVKKLQEEPDLAVVYTDWVMIDARGRDLKLVRCPSYPPNLFNTADVLTFSYIFPSSVLLKKECFEKVGYFDETLRYGYYGEDFDMWVRLVKHGYRFGHVPIPLVKYRLHLGSRSYNYRSMQAGKDQVRLKVLKMLSTEELFGDLVKRDDFNEAVAYEKLAWTFAKGFHFRAAKAALRKASCPGKFSLRRILFFGCLILMETKLMGKILAWIRKRRRLWLDWQQTRKYH